MLTIKKDERGFITFFVVALMLFIMIFAGVFINVIMNYTNINFAKKSMQEATRTRALTTDIYMKERYGIVEAVYPVENGENTDKTKKKSIIERDVLDPRANSALGLRGTTITDPLTKKLIPTRTSVEYKGSVKYANHSAKAIMIDSINAFVGNRVVGSDEDSKMIDLNEKNICFDVKRLEAEDSVVDFSCNVEDNQGVRHTISASIEVSGYKSLEKQNLVKLNNTEDGVAEMQVVNVVFGGAVITPKLYLPSAISSFTFSGEQNQYIYSIAYPQIDTCYSEDDC